MVSLTKKERETLLILFKDFTNFYNANSISKTLKISHVGAQKIFKRLLKGNIVTSRTIGKSIIYKLHFNNSYVSPLIAFLLVDEADNFKRWKEEFKEFEKPKILILFGSVLKNKDYKDIDLLIVIENKNYSTIMNLIDKKNKILIKPVHPNKIRI